MEIFGLVSGSPQSKYFYQKPANRLKKELNSKSSHLNSISKSKRAEKEMSISQADNDSQDMPKNTGDKLDTVPNDREPNYIFAQD